MEFSFDLPKLVDEAQSTLKITRINKDFLKSLDRSSLEIISSVIDKIGKASTLAQGLQTAITSYEKLINSDHVLYLLASSPSTTDKKYVIGIIKIGHKKLFLLNKNNIQVEHYPLCVLDFYIHESYQRHGYGLMLFQHMLQVENVMPQQLAIDKPSMKFLAFLKKHYGLQDTIHQPNNFVIFTAYFSYQDDDKTSASDIVKSQNSPNLDVGINSISPEISFTKLGCHGLNNGCSPCTSLRRQSNLSRIKWHQHHSLNSSWTIFGIPPPATTSP